MPTLTKKHFVWLANQVAPHIHPFSLKQFTDEVARFSDNPTFDREKFERAMEGVAADRQMLNDIPAHELKIDDDIPY